MDKLRDKVLVLNRHWQAINECSVAVALCDLCRGVATGIDTATMLAVKWEDWLKLEIRDTDRFVTASQDRRVRVPSVICKASFDKVPKKRPKLDRRGVAERDGYICQVTGEHAPDGTIDHLMPRSRGGKNAWDNLAWMRKDINHKKGNKTLDEAGLKLRRKPFTPSTLPVTLSIKRRPDKPDWDMFLLT